METLIRKTTLTILPNPSLLSKLGRSNFTLAFALGEFIDNSFDARLGSEPVVVSIDCEKDSRTITVQDNAMGMDEKDLQDALTLGASNKKPDAIGFFGLGLKAAATFLSDRFTIETTPLHSATSLRVGYDSRVFNDWSVELEEIPRIPDLEHGTRITLHDVNVSLADRQIGDSRRAIAEVYRRLIGNNKLKIIMNSKTVECPKYELLLGLYWEIDLNINGKRARGWVAAARTRKKGGTLNFTPGFYLFRHDRMVKKGEWIGIQEHPAVRTLVGELDLDDFEVTNNKTDFLRDTPSWTSLVSSLSEFLKKNSVRQKIFEGTTTIGGGHNRPANRESADSSRPRSMGQPTSVPESKTAAIELPAQLTNNTPASETICSAKSDEDLQPRVFVVHGLDNQARTECEVMLKDLGVIPIVLEDSPAGGVMWVLDKFEKYAKESDYAVIILTPDDWAWCPDKGEGQNQAKPRPRQNVMFEFGYFVRRSRRRTACLHKSGCGLDIPTDVLGVHYIPYTVSIMETRTPLRKELEAAGILRPDNTPET